MTSAPKTVDRDEPKVERVILWVCNLCLDGAGGFCHVPGCAFCNLAAPELNLRLYTEPAALYTSEQPDMNETPDSVHVSTEDVNGSAQPDQKHWAAGIGPVSATAVGILDSLPDASAQPAVDDEVEHTMPPLDVITAIDDWMHQNTRFHLPDSDGYKEMLARIAKAFYREVGKEYKELEPILAAMSSYYANNGTIGINEQEALAAIAHIREMDSEAAQRELLQGLVDNAPSDTHKKKRNDAYYFDIGWEVLKVLGEMNRAYTGRLTNTDKPSGTTKGNGE